MKISLALLYLLTATQLCSAQSNARMDECQKALDKSIDPSLYAETCSAIVRQLGPSEHVATVFDDGGFITTDGIIHERKLPRRIASALALNKVRKSYLGIVAMTGSMPQGDSFSVSLLSDYTKNIWVPVREEFCKYHSGESYQELSNTEAVCPGTIHSITGQATAQTAPLLLAGRKGTGTCQKAITFALAQSSGLSYELPNVSAKWLSKIEKKYPNVCFVQFDTQPGRENYLILLSSSRSAYTGLQPIFRRSTSMIPVSGTGTLTENNGSTWNFTYQGTMTTTTTTEVNVPYTDTSARFYAYAYGEDGSLVGTSERSTSSRQGGDPSNSLGYNLTSALLSIHLKEHLLENIVSKVSALP